LINALVIEEVSMKTLVSVLILASGILLIIKEGQWVTGLTLMSMSVLVESGVADRFWAKIDDELTREF
jgi:hypothetical protein